MKAMRTGSFLGIVWALALGVTAWGCWTTVANTTCAKGGSQVPTGSGGCGVAYASNVSCPSAAAAWAGVSGQSSVSPSTTAICSGWSLKSGSGGCVNDTWFSFTVHCRNAFGAACVGITNGGEDPPDDGT